MKIKKHIPNILSSLRLLSPIVLIPLIISGNYLIAGICVSCFFATDALDGFLARKWHVESELGAKIDATADKLMLSSFLIPLALNNPLIFVNLVFEALISLVNVSRKLKGGKPKTVQIGRVKMVAISIFTILSYLTNVLTIPNVIYNILFAVTTLLQVGTLGKYSVEAQKESLKNPVLKVNNVLEDNETKDCETKNVKMQTEKVFEQVNDLSNKKEELLKLREELLNLSNNNGKRDVNVSEKVKIKKNDN